MKTVRECVGKKFRVLAGDLLLHGAAKSRVCKVGDVFTFSQEHADLGMDPVDWLARGVVAHEVSRPAPRKARKRIPEVPDGDTSTL